MICRLCLEILIEDSAISLFDCSQGFGHKEVVPLILKYFQFEVTTDDPVSTTICQACFDHLKDFHSFWELVEKKQETIRQQQKTEFLEINCGALPTDNDNLLEILSEVGDAVAADAKQASTVLHDVLLEPATVVLTQNESNAGTDDGFDNMEQDIFSSDDEIPLENLKKGAKTKKVKVSKRVVKKQESGNKMKKSAYAECVTKDIELYCELCDAKNSIGNYEELIKHFSEQHTGQQAFIKCCGKTLSTRRTFSRHLTWHRNPEKFKCAICGKQLGSRTSLKTHLDSHQKLGAVESDSPHCKLCERSFSTKKRYINHLNWHTKQEKPEFNCEFCNRTYTNENRLKRHVEGLHSHVYPYKCLACNEPFNFKADLDAHNDTCKNKVNINQNADSLNEGNQCNICHKTFSRPQHLQRHIDCVHNNSAPYVCHECGKDFKFKPTFEKHLLEHSGVVEQPVQCEKCGKWLKNKNSHRLHLYRHDGFLSKCHLCGKECPSRPALKGHIENFHRHEKNYKCRFCEKSFKTPNSLKEHVATHTGIQLYSCPHCPKECRSKSNMYVHIKNNHVDEWAKSKIARSYDPNIKAAN